MLKYQSKLPSGDTSIFAIMSGLASRYNAINLGQGFPNFDCDDVLKEKINHYLKSGKNQYCPMPGYIGLREELAKKYEASYNQKINAATDITITAGATQAIYTAITAFIKPGDEVIIFEPAYDSYVPSIQLNGGKHVTYKLKAPDYTVDWNKFEDLISSKTRMILINTPQNPIGKTFKEADLKNLENIIKDKDIILLSDEVYEHLIYDDQKHQSAIMFPHLFQQSLCTYSFGKTFHSTGWKLGYCIGPNHLMQEFRKTHQWVVFSVNSFLQYALADYLKDPKPYLGLPKFYQQKRDFFAKVMEGSRLNALHCEGTYFQLFDYSGISQESDLDFAKRLTQEYGVASIPVSPFYSDRTDGKVIRFCFAKTEDILEQAAQKLKAI